MPNPLPLAMMLLALAASAASAAAQGTAPPPPAAAPGGANRADPEVATVDGRAIRLSDLGRLTATLPAAMRLMPYDRLYPELLERAVDEQALVVLAFRAGLDQDAAVRRDIAAATDTVLANDWLKRRVAAAVTEADIRVLYQQRYADKPGPEQVDLRLMLLPTEADAKQAIADLGGGADFAVLARQRSLDASSAQGGALGFVSRDQIEPEFAAAVFALQGGQVTPQPLHGEAGWYVAEVAARRTLPTPTFAETHDALKDELTRQAMRQAMAEARGQVSVLKFNLDGSAMADPSAPRPPAPAPASR